MGQSWSRYQQKKNAKALKDLAPKKTPGHDSALPTLDRNTLQGALSSVAAYVRSKGANINVIAVGGAVNTIHLRSRAATHDVDFYNNDLTVAEFELLIKGMREAVKRNKSLEEGWFNNRTIFFMPQDRRDLLTQQAFQQAEVIFQEPGLTVYAAPWDYAFCCKVDRLAGGGSFGARSYDLSDAVQYLNRYLAGRGLAQVKKSTVREWFAQYHLRWTMNNDRVVQQVNEEYRAVYRVNYDPIV